MVRLTSKATLLRLIPVVLLIAAVVAFFALGFNHYLTTDTLRANETSLRAFVSEHPVGAPLIFVIAYVAVVALSLPGAAIMTTAGGFIFHLWLGVCLNVIGATLGAIVLYVVARFVAGDALRTRAGPFMARMAEGFDRNAFSYLLFLRLVPAFPFFAVNLVAALIGVSLPTFAVATFIGIIPGSLAFTSLGDGLGLAVSADQSQVTPVTVALRAGLVLLAFIPLIVKWLRQRRAT